MSLIIFGLMIFYLVGGISEAYIPEPKSEIRFGYGMSYKYHGKMLHGLNRYHLMVAMEIPDLRMAEYYTPFEDDPTFCDKWRGNPATLILYLTCKNVWPAYMAMVARIRENRKRVYHIMTKEIPAVIPGYDTEPISEPHFHSTLKQRKKRFISDVISLGMQGVSAYLQYKKQSKIEKGLKRLQSRVGKNEKRIEAMEDDMISLAETTLHNMQNLRSDLQSQGMYLRALSGQVKDLKEEVAGNKVRTLDNSNSLRFLSGLMTVMLSDCTRYNTLYERAITELGHFLEAMDTLSTNMLSHTVVAPDVLEALIQHVKQELIEKYPDYELVLDQVHEYYNLPVSTFFYSNGSLVIHIPLYIKPKLQEPLLLYDIASIPVPYHMNEALISDEESSHVYTHVKPSTEILAMSSDTYINLNYKQLEQCMQYNVVYFCQHMYLVKHNSEHTCESAIYHRKEAELIKSKCDIQYFPYLNPEPAILDAGDHLLLGNLPQPWSYMCNHNDQIPNPIKGGPYVIIKKADLCQCSLSAGTWYLQDNIVYCTESLDTQLTLYYSTNMAVVIYQAIEKAENEEVTDVTLYKEEVTWDPDEPGMIVEMDDDLVLEHDIDSVPYERVIQNAKDRKYYSRQDLAVALTESESWFSGDHPFLLFVALAAVITVVVTVVVIIVTYKVCGNKIRLHKLNTLVGTMLATLGKMSHTPAIEAAAVMKENEDGNCYLTEYELIEVLIKLVAVFLAAYLVYKIAKRLLNFYNSTNLAQIQTRLTLFSFLTMDRTDIYLQLFNARNSCAVDLHIGSIFGNPEDLAFVGQFQTGQIRLEQNLFFDYLNIDWTTSALSLLDLELQMPAVLPVPLHLKFLMRKLFHVPNTLHRIIAYNPNSRKVYVLSKVYEVSVVDVQVEEGCVQPAPSDSPFHSFQYVAGDNTPLQHGSVNNLEHVQPNNVALLHGVHGLDMISSGSASTI